MIQRTIALMPFKNLRNLRITEATDDDAHRDNYYGTISNAIIVSDDKQPFLKNIKLPEFEEWMRLEERDVKNGRVLRYRTIIDLLQWIWSFTESLRIFKTVTPKTNLRIVEITKTIISNDETFFDKLLNLKEYIDTLKFVNILPTNENVNTLELSNTECEHIVYSPLYDIAVNKFDNIRNIYDCLKFLLTLSDWENDDYDINECRSFYDVNIVLTEKYYDNGLFSSYARNWTPFTVYHLHDIVIYDNTAWILNKAEENDTYSGYLDDNYNFHFDEPNNKHWEMVESGYDGTSFNTPIDNKQAISKMKLFMRTIRTSDYDGNYLPFIERGDRYETLFTLGKTNVINGSCDILESVRFFSSKDNDISLTIAYKEGGENDIVKGLKGIDYNSDFSLVEKEVLKKCDRAEFKYRYRAINSENVQNNGISYTDVYPFSIKDVPRYRESDKEWNEPTNVSYIDIDITSNENAVSSTIQYNSFNEGNFQNIPIYKNDLLNGIHYMDIQNDVPITRGKSSARERHNILSEIDTFQDLVNYRNNYFKIS